MDRVFTQRESYLLKTLPRKLKLISNKKRKGFRIDWFFRKGNGIRTLLKKTGRLSDFKGIFIITGRDHRILHASASRRVVRDIQKLARGMRVKDLKIHKQIARYFGYRTSLAGQQYLRSMKVTWMEVANDTERQLLEKAIQRRQYSI